MFYLPLSFIRQRAVDSPVILHQQSKAAIVPRSLPQTGEDEQQELEHRAATWIPHSHNHNHKFAMWQQILIIFPELFVVVLETTAQVTM